MCMWHKKSMVIDNDGTGGGLDYVDNYDYKYKFCIW